MAIKKTEPRGKTQEPRDEKGRFLPGNSGFGGRPKGSRNKFAQQYIDDYYEIWQQEGKEALRACAKKKPDKFVMVAAHLIPQHFKIEHEHKLSMLSDQELQQRLLEAQEELRRAGLELELEAKEVAALPAPSGLIHSGDSQIARRSSCSLHESRNYREGHAGGSPSA